MKKTIAGSVSLLVATIILPFMFFLFALSLDITKYNREVQNFQFVADEATLFAYQFLPSQAGAQHAVEDYLVRSLPRAYEKNIAVTGDSIAVSLEAQSNLLFAKYFVSDAALKIGVYSKARGTPFDTFIALDTSTYVGPDSVSRIPWGDAQSWPASQFFELERPFYELNANGESVQVDPRYITQLCFNPIFSALKRTAIRIYENLAGFQLNAVGFGFFPGSSANYVDVIRPVQFGLTPVTEGGEAHYLSYNRRFGGNDLCMASAEREHVHDDYLFPAQNSLIEGLWHAPTGAPQRVIPDVWHYNSEYQEYLKTSEVIWSHVVHEQLPETSELLREMRSLLIPPFFDQRGGLKNRPQKTGIIIMGDVPYVAGGRFFDGSDLVSANLATEFQAMRELVISDPNLSMHLYFVLLTWREDDFSDLLERANRFGAFLEEQSLIDGATSNRFSLKLIQASHPETLARSVVGNLVLEKRTSMLSR